MFIEPIAELVEFHIKNFFVSNRNVAEQITKEAETEGVFFPFVTVPEFEVVASQARDISGAANIYWGPRVKGEEESLWSAYSAENQSWLTKSRLYALTEEGQTTTWDEAGYDDKTIYDFIYNTNEEGYAIPVGEAGAVYEPLWYVKHPFSLVHIRTRI